MSTGRSGLNLDHFGPVRGDGHFEFGREEVEVFLAPEVTDFVLCSFQAEVGPGDGNGGWAVSAEVEQADGFGTILQIPGIDAQVTGFGDAFRLLAQGVLID